MGLRSWLQENPGLFLAVLIAITAFAALIEAGTRQKRARSLRELASKWRMTYSPHDHLRITERIAHKLAAPGAADISVSDLIYGTRGDRYFYIFTAQYTTGVVSGKQRQLRVASFSEPRDRQNPAQSGPVTLAPEGLGLLEQYRGLGPDRELT
jgi:hypothetical protein